MLSISGVTREKRVLSIVAKWRGPRDEISSSGTVGPSSGTEDNIHDLDVNDKLIDVGAYSQSFAQTR